MGVFICYEYMQEKQKNQNDFKHVYVFQVKWLQSFFFLFFSFSLIVIVALICFALQDIDTPDANSIKAIEEILASEFTCLLSKSSSAENMHSLVRV